MQPAGDRIMNKQSKIRWITVATAAALVAATAGCQSNSSEASGTRYHGEQFQNDDAPRAVRNIAAVQAATGARADATLHPSHFNAVGLNSLGREKIEMMLQDEESTPPLVVYLDVPSADECKADHQVVMDYLKGRGLAEAQYKVVDGPNPRELHPAVDAIAGVQAIKQAGVSNAAAAGGQGNGYSAPAAAPTPPTGDSK